MNFELWGRELVGRVRQVVQVGRVGVVGGMRRLGVVEQVGVVRGMRERAARAKM